MRESGSSGGGAGRAVAVRSPAESAGTGPAARAASAGRAVLSDPAGTAERPPAAQLRDTLEVAVLLGLAVGSLHNTDNDGNAQAASELPRFLRDRHP